MYILTLFLEAVEYQVLANQTFLLREELEKIKSIQEDEHEVKISKQFALFHDRHDVSNAYQKQLMICCWKTTILLK